MKAHTLSVFRARCTKCVVEVLRVHDSLQPVRLVSERVITPGGTVDAEVSLRDGVIESVGPRRPRGGAVDLGDRWLAPGLIDGHVHGGGGAHCNSDDPDRVLAVARFHAAHGTTALLATTVAAPLPDLELAVRAINAAARRGGDGAAVLGAHLEGPFLSLARHGAMDPRALLVPDRSALRRLLEAGGGAVRMMTLAPELPGALELIADLAAAGVLVSLGHSEAGEAQARAAVDRGARSVTHLFNAMPSLHHRSPGLVGAALDHDRLSCEVIPDGVHVEPSVVRLALRAKGPAGLRLVTDAISAAGMGDGEYRLGALRVRVEAGRATLADGPDGRLAGSTLTMDAAVRAATEMLGISVPEAVAMASANPARALGLERRKGAIAPGLDADLTVLDDDLRACGTLVAGRWVYGPADA